MDEASRRSREDLEAMRKEYGAGQRGGPGLLFNLDDDLRQIRVAERLDLSLADWAGARGLPVEYARALARHIQKYH